MEIPIPMMEFKQDITIKEQIDLSPLSLFMAIERLKWEVGRLISDDTSEEGTLARESKRLRDEFENVESEFI